MKINTIEELNNQSDYKDVLVKLLYQLADDDFLISYRGSEWLGLCPHIEEDVAYSSINQNTMGHAAMYYQLLEEIGEGKADSLAHGRKPEERLNAILLEVVNGTGHYLHEPRYDWAFTVVRHFFYDLAKKVRLDSLKNSSFEPLAQVAVKVNSESYYHLMHWRTWFTQLVSANEEARSRMVNAIEKTWEDLGGVLILGPKGKEMSEVGLIEKEEILRERWKEQIKVIFDSLKLEVPREEPGIKRGNGRKGEHTQDLDDAIAILSEVYNLNPAVAW